MATKTLAVLSRKGGAGKTTLTAHLGVLAHEAGLRVLMLDADPQGSLSYWSDLREAEQPEIHTCTPTEVPELIKTATNVGFDLVLVDSAPAHSSDISLLAKHSDYVVIPTRPALFDIAAVGATIEIITALKKRGCIVLNATQAPRGVGEASLTTDARAALADEGLPVAPFSVAQRAVLGRSLISGSAVTETEPKGKASSELRKLWQWIEGELNG